MIRFAAILLAVCATAGLGSAAATPKVPSAPSATPPGLVWSGSRGKPLPRFVLKEDSTLRWTMNGPGFQIINQDGNGGGVNSTAHSGAAFLKAGPHLIEVYSWGPWTVRVVKGIEHPQSLGGGFIGFRGNGGRELPPFTTKRGTKLVWTNNGTLFKLESGPFSTFISSQGKRGVRAIPPGLHEYVINALGTWTIGWKP